MTSPILDAREYKLLLKPSSFSGARGGKFRAGFWEDTLVAAITEVWTTNRFGALVTDGDFKLAEERHVQFFDTTDAHFALNAYSLRCRQDRAGSKGRPPPAEWSLKLRTPDLFIASTTKLAGKSAGAKSKFEEDIAPLPGVPTSGSQRPANGTSVHLIRTRFSQSTRQQGPALKTVGQVFNLFPDLATNLESAGVSGLKRSVGLIGGPEIAEAVYEGPRVDLGNGIEAEFALSLWNVDAKGALPKAAEISFKCKLKNGAMSAAPAVRAASLFAGLRDRLADHAEIRNLSKTALAAPVRLGAAERS